jgi:ferric-dicitrate binding protein FerR (iron transport regulator)
MPDRTQSIPPAARRRTAAPAASPREAQRREGRRRLANFVAGLAILAAGVLVALAILQTSGKGDANRVNEGDVHGQVQGLEDLIRSNSE